MVDTFTRQEGSNPKYARLVPLAEIEANDFNLNLPRYIDSAQPEDLQDITAHLRGGIPNADIDGLAAYWQVLPTVPGSQIKAAIFSHPEFTAFNQTVSALYATWVAANTPLLSGLRQGDRPKALIETLAENLLETFRSGQAVASLIDPYGVYQHLMDYWAEVMQDDAWMIASDGWQALQGGKPNIDLIPTSLIVNRYFAQDQAAIAQLEAARDAITRQMEELDEEHGSEGGLLEDAKNDKGKLTKVSAKARLADIKRDTGAADERKLLEAYLLLAEQEATASKAVKDATKALDAKVAAQYARLTLPDIQTLVVHDKWLAALAARVQGELDRVSQALTGRIRELTDRYATPLPQLTTEVEALSAKVQEHLKRMGATWN